MPHTLTVTTSSQLLGNTSSIPTQSILQTLITVYGFSDIHSSIAQSNNAEQNSKLQLQKAIFQFDTQPTLAHRDDLMQLLEKECNAVQKQYERYIQERDFYQKLVDANEAAKPPSTFFARWMENAVYFIQDFFGSTDLQQVEKYQAAINQSEQKYAALTAYMHALRIQELPSLQNEALASRSSPTSNHYITQSLVTGNTTERFTMEAEKMGDRLGTAISVGEVDGDGVQDILVGAPGHNENVGSAYVVLGYEGLGNNGSITLAPGGNISRMDGDASTQSQAGLTVSVVENVKTAGKSAVLVGAGPHIYWEGRVYMRYGGSQWREGSIVSLPNTDGINGKTFFGADGWDFLGVGGIAGADVRNVGTRDLFIGAIGYKDALGKGYSVHSDQLDESPTRYLNSSDCYITFGSTEQAFLGLQIEDVGDFNQDGYSDFAIGAPALNHRAGALFLVYGGPAFCGGGQIHLEDESTYYGIRFDGENPGDFAGASFSAVSYGVYIYLGIAAPGYDTERGCTYIVSSDQAYGRQYNLGRLKKEKRGEMIEGESRGDRFGSAVRGVNIMAGKDSCIAVGAPGYHKGRGCVYVYAVGYPYLDVSKINGADRVKIEGESAGDNFGYAIGSGDIHGEGKDSLVVGAPGYRNASGRVYVFETLPPSNTPSDRFPWWLVWLAVGVGAGSVLLLGAAYYWSKEQHRKSLLAAPLLSVNLVAQAGDAVQQQERKESFIQVVALETPGIRAFARGADSLSLDASACGSCEESAHGDELTVKQVVP